jgi:hypothetical protein
MNSKKLLLFCALTMSLPAFMSAWSLRSEEGQEAEFAEDQADIDAKKASNKAATKKKQEKLDAEKKKVNADKKASKKSKDKKEKAYKKRQATQEALSY